MKLNKWLYGVTALAMLAACSDKDVAPGGEPTGGGEHPFVSGVNYLGINIELPTEPTSRAADDGSQGNDNFADGTPSEYNVDNAAILLFFGKEEESAEFVGAYTLLEDESYNEPDKDNITTSFHRTIQVLNKPVQNDDETLWGLAIVNYDESHFVISDNVEDTGSYGDLSVENSYAITGDGKLGEKESKKLIRLKDKKDATQDQPAVVPTTFGEFRKYITDCSFVQSRENGSLKSIFMTNSPLCDKPGTKSKPTNMKIQTLAELQYDKFQSTEIAAQQNPAGCIFVERAVAKVTCSEFPKTTILSHAVVADNGDVTAQDVKLTITSVKWMIDNEEKTSYVVRNAITSDPWWAYASSNSAATTNGTRYRFVGGTAMNDVEGDTGDHNWYRTYWCKDPNYSNNKAYNDQAGETTPKYSTDFVSTKVDVKDVFASPRALYPHENTFDINHQNYQNTTRVVFQVQYSKKAQIKNSDGDWVDMEGNCDLYAIRGQLKNFYLQSDAKKLLKRAVLGSNEISEIIREYAKPGITVTYDETSFDISYGKAEKEDKNFSIQVGDYIITNLSFKSEFVDANFAFDDNEKTPEILQNQLDDLKNSANKTYHIVPFTNNVCYYATNIQHFGDTYCKLPADWKGETVEEVYKNKPESYLGRWGMVRNNWYDIAINSIGRLGNAKVPNGNVTTSDDNKLEEWYLSARIHVLSWAKRTQSYDF